MEVQRVPAGDLGPTAAEHVTTAAERAIAARGEFLVAFSGGRTPAPMLRALAATELAWGSVHVLQVDERVVALGDPERNLTMLEEQLLDRIPIPAENVHSMPVGLDDVDGALRAYRAMLRRVAGDPPVLDLVHLGLGPGGQTASLVGEDADADEDENEDENEVAVTPSWDGYRRMTVTLPLINRARQRLWLVSGTEKREAAAQLLRGDPSVPAGRVRRDETLVLLDEAADPRGGPEEAGAPAADDPVADPEELTGSEQ